MLDVNAQTYVNEYRNNIFRPGADNLLAYIESTSFFKDPASARYHMNVEGGLCEHSLNVYHRLRWLCDEEAKKNPDFVRPWDESIAIVGLLHDLCKAGTYVIELKNQKTYDPCKVGEAPDYMVKHDSNGDFIWETVPAFTNNDPMPYGHGEKSVYLIQKYIKLTDEEAFAIRYHMGAWNDGEKQYAAKAFEMYPLAFLVHVADEWATYIDETKEHANG